MVLPNAIPSVVQVCIICLDTNSKLSLISQQKLDEAYKNLIGHHLSDHGSLEQTLCILCTQRLRNFSRLREQSLRARSLMDLVGKHGKMTIKHIELINREENQLKWDFVTSSLGPDHCNLYVEEHIVENKHTTLEKNDNVVKSEQDFLSDEEEMEMCNSEAGGDDNDVGDYDHSCDDTIAVQTRLLEEAMCEALTQVDPLKCEDETPCHVLVVRLQLLRSNLTPTTNTIPQLVHKFSVQTSNALPFKLAIDNEEKAKEAVVTQNSKQALVNKSVLHNQTSDSHCNTKINLKNCVIKLYDIFKTIENVVNDGTLTQTRQASSSRDTLNTDTASEMTQYHAASESATTHEAAVSTLSETEISSSGNSLRTRAPKKMFTCGVCQQTFTRKCALVDHIRTNSKCYSRQSYENKCAKERHFLSHIKTHTGKKPYTCNFCNKNFLKRSNLVSHIKTHTGEKSFACKLCEYKCRTNRVLVNHMRTHTGEKPHSCKLCEYKCSQKGALMRHERTHTGEKPYACKLCNYNSSQKCSLVRHLRRHTGEKPFSCKLCDYKCAHKSYLLIHERNHNRKEPYSRKSCGDKGNFFDILRTHTGEKPSYACKFCEYKSGSRSALLAHVRTHTGEKPYACKFCEYKSGVKSALLLHVRTHTGEKPYACKLCEYKCAAKKSLSNHMWTHTGGKPCSCNLCEYKCTAKYDLVKHMRTHTGEKPYTCNICEYKCAAKNSLSNHMWTHTGEKPWSCNLCEYKCTAKSYLVKHMRIHTGEKAYSCKLCKYKCTQSNYLVRHMRRHTGEKPYSCKLCEYKCALKSTLLIHERTHTGEKPFACKLCEYKCAARCHLLIHKRIHTGEKPYACKFCDYKSAVKSNLLVHERKHTDV